MLTEQNTPIAAGAAMEQPYSALLGEFRRIDS